MENQYTKIQGFKIVSEQAEALKGLGENIGKEIPIISEVGNDKFGAVVWFKQIIGLSINSFSLEQIPDEIFSFDTLKFLYLAYNKIKEIPSAISEMKNLVSLSLKGNKLKELPLLPSTITSLDVSKNRISGHVKLNLPEIRKLNLGDNEIEDINFDSLPQGSVDELNLSANLLKVLPESLSHLSIKKLDLKGNLLTSPDNFIPRSITYLDLSKNSLGPDLDFSSLGRFDHLTELNLSLNKISHWKFSSDQFPNLEILRLTGNTFTSLPDELTSLKKLKKIYAGGNRISDLPQNLCLKDGLELLSLENNQISILPFWINEVRFEINLKKNPIRLV
ncbi:MAG: hypothetical protein D6732_27315 [Methanobacteriota archaeon]|nr:MAG: hypothetical protein D6732_27315 [Euryarchaeota archaeon]